MRSFPTNVWGGLRDVELSIPNSCQLSPVRVARHIARASLLSSLTAVKRKIYLEVPVEDHYLLTVRLINIFYYTENVAI